MEETTSLEIASEENRAPLLVVGLGNPGKRYEKTRHNLGELAVRQMAQQLRWVLKEEKYLQAFIAHGLLEGRQLYLVVPITFMNESGKAVRAVMDFYKLPIEALLVVCDDIALGLGTLRLKTKGSSGGHNGLKSIEQRIGSSNYRRLRMGIGGVFQEEPQQNLADYVLNPFSGKEMEALPALLEKTSVALRSLLTSPIQRVMERVNAKSNATEQLS